MVDREGRSDDEDEVTFTEEQLAAMPEKVRGFVEDGIRLRDELPDFPQKDEMRAAINKVLRNLAEYESVPSWKVPNSTCGRDTSDWN